jgi:hypothetical protein
MCGDFDLEQRPAVPTTLNRAKILYAFLIGTPIRLEIELTHSQQTRKHFLIGTIRPTLAPAPLSTHHSSLNAHHCLAPFLFDTNKPHKIIILVGIPMKTKEKPRSIRHKFALRGMGLPAEVWPATLIAGGKILKAAATR